MKQLTAGILVEPGIPEGPGILEGLGILEGPGILVVLFQRSADLHMKCRTGDRMNLELVYRNWDKT